MNVQRFTARTSRDALKQVKEAFGDDAVVLSTRPCSDGVEVLAMASDGMEQIAKAAGPAAAARAAKPASKLAAKAAARSEPPMSNDATDIDVDVQQLAMSTLSFQDYVRERMLKRRRHELSAADTAIEPTFGPKAEPAVLPSVQQRAPAQPQRPAAAPVLPLRPARREPPVLHDEVRVSAPPVGPVPTLTDLAPARRDQQDMMNELRSMKGLIEERFGALAFMEKLQRSPRVAQLTQKLLDCGFSPALIRKLTEGVTPEIDDEAGWAANVLERNLLTSEAEPALEDQGGVYALIGSTGVGKTTTAAKIAAAFAARHGAANLGLITLDAYRVGAHEQLRAYGRILGVPVHSAHDRASLDDLLDLLSAKKMVLIDTAGVAQRDSRARELLEMVSHRSIRKLLVVNAAAQGETIDEVLESWRADLCAGIVLSKIDEAVKLAPAVDALVRRRVKVIGVANGQRVPEDWHRLSAHALVQRALRVGNNPSWRVDPSEVNLIFAGLRGPAARGGTGAGLPA